MLAQDIAKLARMQYEAYNDRDFDRAGSMVAPNAELRNVATGETFRGPAGTRQFQQGWATAFPDSRVDVRGVVVGEDGYVVEYVGHGTQTGPLSTPAGPIPATNRTVTVEFCDVARLKDGMIASVHTYFDLMTMLRQLGVATEQAGARESTPSAYTR